jgi:hypothetical protein
VPELTQGIIGKLFGEREDLSRKLFEQLYERGLELIAKSKKTIMEKPPGQNDPLGGFCKASNIGF